MSDEVTDLAAKFASAFSTDRSWCPICESRVKTYKKVKKDTRHAGLWYKVRTTYCIECDADLNHETLDSGRR